MTATKAILTIVVVLLSMSLTPIKADSETSRERHTAGEEDDPYYDNYVTPGDEYNEADFTHASQPMNCPDGRTCYHGSECRINQDDGISYYCDCKSIEGSKAYAGSSCEYAATVYCANGGNETNKDSFCTNGGICVETVTVVEGVAKHMGCECSEEFEGDFCEYNRGESPAKKGSQAMDMSKIEEDGRTIKSTVGFLIAVVCIAFIIGAVVTYKKKKREGKEVVAAEESDRATEEETEII